MNKNKLIFAIIWLLFIAIIIFIVFSMNKSWWATKSSKNLTNFTIWMIWDNNESWKKIIENFKKVNTKYEKTKIDIEVFKDYDDYNFALMAAIAAGKTPDIFVLNNNEKKSLFEAQALWIDPKIINPNDFRKKYKWVFSDDLILSGWNKDKEVEFLKWIPVWYETLGIFYNRRYIQDSELKSISALNNIIAALKEKHPSLIPIWIWNGSTVYNSADIMTQFFMLENGVSWIGDISWNNEKQSLATYLLYWDNDGYNNYNSRYNELSKLWKTSLDLFSRWETFMVVGYPSMINIIWEKWFSKNFLQVSPFPHYFSWDGKTLVNYDYFVINKNTKNKDLSFDFLRYLTTDIWAEDFLNNFKYYLPALLSLESDKLEEKISDKYNIILWDFFNSDYELSSFNKWVRSIYDKWIVKILDNSSNYENEFNRLKSKVLCNAKKIDTLKNLSKTCE
jgi:ABC-type glycerol-3-phosphate transport system substrate-binding protein